MRACEPSATRPGRQKDGHVDVGEIEDGDQPTTSSDHFAGLHELVFDAAGHRRVQLRVVEHRVDLRDLSVGGLLGRFGFDQRRARALDLGGSDEALRPAPIKIGLCTGGRLFEMRHALRFEFGEIVLRLADGDVGFGAGNCSDGALYRGLGTGVLRPQLGGVELSD